MYNCSICSLSEACRTATCKPENWENVNWTCKQCRHCSVSDQLQNNCREPVNMYNLYMNMYTDGMNIYTDVYEPVHWCIWTCTLMIWTCTRNLLGHCTLPDQKEKEPENITSRNLTAQTHNLTVQIDSNKHRTILMWKTLEYCSFQQLSASRWSCASEFIHE
jgi:hypothetical protein